MLYPAAGAHPVIDVRKLVLSVEDICHDCGPRNAAPLRAAASPRCCTTRTPAATSPTSSR